MPKKNIPIVLLAYTLLTLLMTYPTVTNLTTAIPGDGFDGWQNYWNQWWIKDALLNQQTHFFFTDILYPPSGVSLLFHTLNFFNGLWTLPLQLNFGLTVAYNAVVFFHFVFSGFGVYLLARYTLARCGFKSKKAQMAAFTAGVIFTFSPFHIAHLLGHMQVLSLTWPPFYILWVLKTLHNWQLKIANLPKISTTPTNHSTKPQFKYLHLVFGVDGLNPKDLALCGLFLALITMVDWYQTLYMLLFTALVLLWTLWHVWRVWTISLQTWLKPIWGLALMGFLFLLIFSSLIVPMVIEASGNDYMRPTFEENVVLSADLLAFFTPSELHPLWGDFFAPYYQNYTTTTSERLIFAGFIPLILAGFTVFRSRRRQLVQFWSVFTLSFFVLALGPYLHIAGNIISIGNFRFPMPYLLLYKLIPFIGISRSLSRFDLMVMIGLGILAALSLVRLKLKYQIPLLILICFEFIAIPYQMSPVDTPSFFYTLAADKDSYNIAYLPMNWDRPAPLLYQTVHQKGLLTAYTSRNNPLDLSWRTPVLQQWRTLNDDIIKVDHAILAPTVLHDFNIKYIVLDYYQMPPGPERDGTEKWVAKALPNTTPIYKDDRLSVYEAPPVTQPSPYLQLDTGWEDLDMSSGYPQRLMSSEATLNLIGSNNQTWSLQLKTPPPNTLSTLMAFSVDTTTDVSMALKITLSTDGTEATILLPPHTTKIKLKNPESISINRLLLLNTP